MKKSNCTLNVLSSKFSSSTFNWKSLVQGYFKSFYFSMKPPLLHLMKIRKYNHNNELLFKRELATWFFDQIQQSNIVVLMHMNYSCVILHMVHIPFLLIILLIDSR